MSATSSVPSKAARPGSIVASGPPAVETAPVDPAESPAAHPINVGEDVEYNYDGRRFRGVVVRSLGIASDGSQRADVVYYTKGESHLERNVPRDPTGEFGFRRPNEGPPRLPTLEEILAEARLRGELVPAVGLSVVVLAEREDNGFRSLYRRRARVVKVKSLTLIDVEYFMTWEPPARGEDDELDGFKEFDVQHMPNRHENMQKRGPTWLHREQFDASPWPVPGVSVHAFAPRFRCPLCSRSAPYESRRSLADDLRQLTGDVCNACHTSLMDKIIKPVEMLAYGQE